MEKLKVNKEVFEALELVMQRNGKEWFLETILCKKRDNKKWSSHYYKVFNELSIEEITRIILYGYELELDKKEVLAEIYKEAKEEMDKNCYREFNRGYRFGVEQALKMLEVEIEGINK